MNQFCYRLAEMVRKARAWNDQLLGSGGQRSRSQEPKVWVGGLGRV